MEPGPPFSSKQPPIGGTNSTVENTQSPSLFTQVSGSTTGNSSAYVVSGRRITGSAELPSSNAAISSTSTGGGGATSSAGKASTTPNTPSHNALPVSNNHPLLDSHNTAMMPVLPPAMTSSNAGSERATSVQVPPYHAPHPPHGVYHAYFSNTNNLLSSRSGAATATANGIKNSSDVSNPSSVNTSGDSRTALPSVLPVGSMAHNGDAPIHHHKEAPNTSAHTIPENDTTVAHVPGVGTGAGDASSHQAPSGSSSGIRWWRTPTSSGRTPVKIGSELPLSGAATARPETGGGHAISSTTSPQSSQPSSARLMTTNHTMEAAGSRYPSNTAHRYHLTDYATESELPATTAGFTNTRFLPSQSAVVSGGRGEKAHYARSTSHTPDRRRLPMSSHQPHATSEPPPSHLSSDGRVISPRPFTSPHTPVTQHSDDGNHGFGGAGKKSPVLRSAQTVCPKTPPRVIEPLLPSHVTPVKPAANGDSSSTAPQPAPHHHHGETDSPPPRQVIVGIDVMRVVAQKRHSPALPRDDEGQDSLPQPLEGVAGTTESRPNSRVNTRVRNVRHGSASDRRSEYTLARRQSPSVQAEVTRLHSTAAGASSGNSSNGSTAQLVPLRASSTLTAAQPALPPTVTAAMVTKTGKPRPEPLLAALDKELSGQNQHQPTALSDVTVLPPAVSHSVAPSMLPPHATASAAATAAPDLLLFHPIHTIGSSVPAPVSHQGSGVHTPQTNAQIITTSPSTGGGGLVEGVRQMSTSFNSQRGNSRRTSRRGSEVTLMAAIAAAEAVAQSTPHTHPHSSSRFSSSGPGTTNENTLSVRDQTSPAMTMITTAENGLLPPVGGAPAHLHSVGGVPSLSGDQLSDAAANKSHAKPGPGHHGGGSPDLAFSPPSSAAQGIQLPSLMSGKTMPATAADVNTAMTVVGAGPAGKTVEDVSISTAEEHLAQHGEDTASKETKTTTTTTATITPQQQQQQQQRGIRWDPANEPKGKASSSAGAANSYTAATNNSSIALGTSSSALNFAALIQELDQRRQRIREQLNEMTKNVAGHSIFAIVRSTSTTQLHQILEAGLCNVNEQDHNGCTPLHIAASEGNQAIVRLLLSYGADILKKDFFGRTPLDCAAANRQSVGRYLISVLRERREAERKQAEKAKANSERAKQSVPSAGETAAAALVVGTPVAASHAPSHFSGGVDLLVTTTPSPERPSSPHNIGVKVGSTTSSTGPVSPDVRQLPPTQNFHSLLLNVMSDSEHVPSPPAVANDLEPSNVGSKSDGISGAIGSGVFPAADVSKLSHSPNQQFSSSPPGHGTIQATPKSSPLFSPYHRAESQLASTVNPSTSFNPMAPGLHFTPRHSILPGVTEERYRAAAAAAAAAESTQRKTVDTPGLLRLPIPAGPDPPSTDIFPSQRGYSIYEEGAVTTLLEHVVAQEQHRRKPVREEKKEFSTFTAINDYVPLIVCMSGLPGRGKSFISKRVLRYLNWKGVPCEVFNAGNYRRQLLGVEGTADAAFFDPNNPVGKQLRERMAELACEDLVKFIADHQPLSVGILDATNTTRSRRRWLETFFAEAAKKHSNPDGTPLAYRLLFIESVCTDENIITENILRSKCDNDDFKGTEDTNAVISEFRERIHQYEKVYEPLHADENFSFIKIINVKHHVVLHRVAGGLGSRIAFFLMNLHPVAFPVYLALPGETVGESKGEFGGDERLTERGVQYAFALRQFMEERFVPNMLVIHATSKSVVNTLLPATVPSAASGIVGGSVAASTTNTNVPDLPGFEDLQQIQGAESRQRRGFSSPVEEGSINRLSGTSHHHHHHSSTANLGTSTTGGNVSRGLPRVTSGDRILLERQLTNRAAMPVVVHRHVHANAREMPKPDSQSFIGTPTSGVPTSGAAASFAANSSGSPSSQRDLFSPGVAWRQNKETTPTDKKSGAMEAKKNTPISSAGPQLLPTPTKVSVAEVPASTLVVKSGERPDHGGSASTSTSIGLNVRITEDIVVESPKQKRGRHHHRRRRRGGVPEKQKDESGGADNNGKHRGPVHHRHGHRHHHTIMSTILTEHDPQPSISTPSVRDPSKNTSLTTTSGKENPRQESPASPEQDKDSMGSSISSSSSSGSSASSSSSASAKLVDQQAAPGRRRSAEIELGLYAALSPTYTESDSAGSSTNSYASSSTGTSNASNSGSGNPTLKIDHSAPAVSSMIVKSSVVTVREPTPEGVDHDDGNPHGSSSRPPLSHPPLHPLIHSPIATAASRSSHSHHKQPSAEDQKKKKIKRGTAGGGNSSGSSPALSRQHSFTNNPSVIRTTANGGLGGIGKGGLGAAGANRPLPRLASSSHLAATHHHVPYPHPTSSREPPPTQQPYEGNEDNMENGEELDEVLCPVPGLDDLNYGKLNGRRPGWFQEQNPRAAQILFSKLGRTNSVASLLAGDGMERSHTTDEEDEQDEQDVEEDVEEEEAEVLKEVLAAAKQQQQEEGADHNESSAREPVSAPPLLPFLIKGNTTRTVLSTLRHCWRRFEKHYKNAPHASSTATTYYPTLNYTALFPNGESVRQVISRLEPALMAVMRSQKPVFVVAPAIPTQGLLAFFLDVMPEKSPLLKLPKNGILEITVKGDVMVHPLPPAQMGSSLAGDESLMEITV